jgi:hypothetical protein
MCVKRLLKQIGIESTLEIEKLTPGRVLFSRRFCFQQYFRFIAKIFEKDYVNSLYSQSIGNNHNASQSILDCDLDRFTYDLLDKSYEDEQVMSPYKVLSEVHSNALTMFRERICFLVHSSCAKVRGKHLKFCNYHQFVFPSVFWNLI